MISFIDDAPPLPVILIGATGECGRHALVAALAALEVSKVLSFGRSPPTNIGQTTSGSEKLTHTGLNFEKLCQADSAEAAKLASTKASVVIIALGTSRAKAGSADQFVRIDREYVLAAARAARVEGVQQTLVYCSVSGDVIGANSSTGIRWLKPISCPGTVCRVQQQVQLPVPAKQGTHGGGPGQHGLQPDCDPPAGDAARPRRAAGRAAVQARVQVGHPPPPRSPFSHKQ